MTIDYTDMALAEEQMLKAASFFGKVLDHHGRDRMAARIGGVAIVVARGVGPLAELDTRLDGFLPLGFSTPPAEPLLKPLYHVPTSQTWAGSGGRAQGNVHLHVMQDMTLGRRVRKRNECLCSKKHGTYERPPEGETNLCPECVKVAEQNKLPIPPL